MGGSLGRAGRADRVGPCREGGASAAAAPVDGFNPVAKLRLEEMTHLAGGSAHTELELGASRRWKRHPVAALVLRVFIGLAPLVLAFLAATFVGSHLSRGDTVASFMFWLGAVVVVSMTTVVVGDRALERLLPLVALLRLSLAFPDENVPSRVSFALRSGTARQLERRLDEGKVDPGEREAVRTLLTLLTVLRDHDRLTRGHSERVRAFSALIAEHMDLSERERDLLNWGALAHDVGKLAVDPEILAKKGRPTTLQWEQLREHPAAAETIIGPIRPWLGEWADAATQHHERWDGQGYPAGLAGREISRAGRIVAVADAFDVMTAARSYKPPLPVDDALAEVARNAGTQFDPAVVRAFLAIPPRRIRMVMGSFGWVGNVPLLGEMSAAGSAGTAAASAVASIVAAGAAVLTLVTPSFDGLNPVEYANPWASGSHEATAVAPDDPETDQTDQTDEIAREVEPAPADDGSPTTAAPPGVTPTTAGPDPTGTASADPGVITPPDPADPGPTVTIRDDDETLMAGAIGILQILNNDSTTTGDVDPRTVSVVDPPTQAVSWVILASGHIQYEAPDTSVDLTDRLIYSVCDESGSCDTATVNISITARANAAP